MASTYTPLGVELQATGENAGTWGTKTNTNLQLVEQILGGFTQQSIAGGAQTTALSVSDGSTGATLAHRMIEFTGTISGNQIVTIPLDVQTFYILRNSTSGSHTVQFKYASGSGSTFTFSASDKGDKIVFAAANDGTNPDIKTLAIGTGIANVVEDTTPQLGGDLDVNGQDIVSTSNADIDIIPNGTGDVNLGADTVQIGDNNADATLTTQGTGDLILNTNNGTNAGNITLADGANGDINFTTNGTGAIKFNDIAYIPQQALTSSSNAVAWDAQAKPNAFHLTTENTTFSAPTNNIEGSFICLEINYNGSHTIAFNTVFEFAASTAPTFTSSDGKTDILVFRYNGAVWQEVGRTLNLSES
jgi:hypothetical protein